MPTSQLQTITDELLVSAIGRASSRVVFVAPAVWPSVAKALAGAWHRLGADHVSVILDVDAEVCRLGYGSVEGLEILQQTASALNEAIGHEPGVRICVLIADEQTFVFSPTPQLIEEPPRDGKKSTSPKAARTNGIVLTTAPANLRDQLGAGGEGIGTRSMGLEAVQSEKVKAVAKDLKDNPPKSFDLARAVNVYNAAIRFVEFRVGRYRVSEHKASLPKHLDQISKRNKKLNEKIERTIKLLDEDDPLIAGDGPVTQSSVEEARRAIEEEFLRPVKGIGKVINRSDIVTFEAKVAEFDKTLLAFSKVLKLALGEKLHSTANELADALLPEVLRDLPENWQKQLGPNPNPEHIRFRILDDLLRSFGDAERRSQSLKSTVVFKDVTYDMLRDPEFSKAIAEYFPDLALMEEYHAAKERGGSQQQELSLG